MGESANVRSIRARRQNVRVHGLSLLEVSVAAAMLAVLLGVSLRVFRAVSEQERSLARRDVALQTAQNVLEQAEAMKWDEVTTATLENQMSLSHAGRQSPPHSIAIDVREELEPVAAKQVTVQFSWLPVNGKVTAPVRLTTWIYP
jgi:hypothetical protein